MPRSPQPKISLYTYPLSSCAARVRLALSYKSLAYTPITLNTLTGIQFEEKYMRLNPSASVPTLIIHRGGDGETGDGDGDGDVPGLGSGHDSGQDIVLGQSWSILEYLDEAFPPPDYPGLLPSAAAGDTATALQRALIRELAMVIVSDTQPVTNTRVLKRVQQLVSSPAVKKSDKDNAPLSAPAAATTAGPDREHTDGWLHHFYTRGLSTYEKILSASASPSPPSSASSDPNHSSTTAVYSVGHAPSLADMCLVPAVWNYLRLVGEKELLAEREGRDWPNVKRVYDRLVGEEWVRREMEKSQVG